MEAVESLFGAFCNRLSVTEDFRDRGGTVVERRPCEPGGESLFVLSGDMFPGVVEAVGDEDAEESKPRVADVAKT